MKNLIVVVLAFIIAITGIVTMSQASASNNRLATRPIVDRSYTSTKSIVARGNPVILDFTWHHSMDVLDDYGYLVVEDNDMYSAGSEVKIACTDYYKDESSGKMVFLCASFHGQWIGENDPTNTVISYSEGFRRNFMITSDDMYTLFQYGAYSIH